VTLRSDKYHILPYLLTPWSRVLLEKLTGSAASQEIPRNLWNPEVHHRTHNTKHLKNIFFNTFKLRRQKEIFNFIPSATE
jgi:hypothetical protein